MKLTIYREVVNYYSMVIQVVPSPKVILCPQKETFCQVYDRCHNATRAACAAGYSPASAHGIGYNLLHEDEVLARLKELDEAKEFDPAIASANERRKILSEIARASVPDYQTETGLKIDANSPNVRAIRSVEVNILGQVTKLKLADAVAAIQEHNKMDGIGRDAAPVTDARTVIINVTSPDTRTMLNAVGDCLLPPAIDSQALPRVVDATTGEEGSTGTNDGPVCDADGTL